MHPAHHRQALPRGAPLSIASSWPCFAAQTMQSWEFMNV
jgi:hypothetical protein